MTTKVVPVTLKRAAEIAEACNDAYSFDAFGATEWPKAARLMARRGFTEREIEAVLRSKWTRWSRDMQGTYRGTAKGLGLFLDTQTPDALQALVEGHFGSTGDPELGEAVERFTDSTSSDLTPVQREAIEAFSAPVSDGGSDLPRLPDLKTITDVVITPLAGETISVRLGRQSQADLQKYLGMADVVFTRLIRDGATPSTIGTFYEDRQKLRALIALLQLGGLITLANERPVADPAAFAADAATGFADDSADRCHAHERTATAHRRCVKTRGHQSPCVFGNWSLR